MKKVILSCLKMNLKISHQLKSSDIFIVAPHLVKGGAGFLNSTRSEWNQNFSKSIGRGGGGEGKRGIFEIFFGGWGGLLEMKL